jgi:hypothetical protein
MPTSIRFVVAYIGAVIVGVGSGLLVTLGPPTAVTEVPVFLKEPRADVGPAAPRAVAPAVVPAVPAPSAAILEPVDGARVERSFEAAGTLNLPPSSGQYAWVAVEVENGTTLVWPKAELHGSQWRTVIDEGGNPPGGRFRLVVIQIQRPARDRIFAWFEAGRRTGRYPGLDLGSDLGGATVLTGINLQLRR